MTQQDSGNNSATINRGAGLPDLLAGVARQDRAAFQQLYRETSAKLFGICLRISCNRTAAEDILQDVYVKIWNSVGQYDRSKGSAAAWLAMIARNSALDWIRSNKRHAHGSDDLLAQKADESPLADTVMEHGQEKAKIENCLDGLDESQGKPIRAAFFGGLTYERLAERMDIPLSTMKSRIRRGLANLRECLENV